MTKAGLQPKLRLGGEHLADACRINFDLRYPPSNR
jgi:hypothetical protein